ncbi:MAG: TatD family hydrolase [bacterium]|nr:TatD family hydrolase [bacterium]
MSHTLIDTHAHLNFEAFKDDFEGAVGRAQVEGVEKIINVGANLDSSQKAAEIAQKFDGCFASVGIHPHHAEDHNPEDSIKTLEKLAKSPKVVAIGECGLDYHPYENGGIADPKKQKELFTTHLELAEKLNLPLILHCRDAHDDILRIIKPYVMRYTPSAIRGVFHCFSGDQEFLASVLKMGFYVGFDGNITYRNVRGLRELVKTAPLERIILETDSPYLPPEPFRGLRNEPKNVKIIAGAVAEIKTLPFVDVARKTTQNARRLFRI